DNNVTIHQGRHFNASVDRLECFVVRPEQPVNRLKIQALVLQRHAHLARERTERTVIQFDHDMTSCLRLHVDRLNPPSNGDHSRHESEMTRSARTGHPPYSITSSANNRSDSGMVRPSPLAVFKFTTTLNFVGNWTGRSAGFAPRRMRST